MTDGASFLLAVPEALVVCEGEEAPERGVAAIAGLKRLFSLLLLPLLTCVSLESPMLATIELPSELMSVVSLLISFIPSGTGIGWVAATIENVGDV